MSEVIMRRHNFYGAVSVIKRLRKAMISSSMKSRRRRTLFSLASLSKQAINASGIKRQFDEDEEGFVSLSLSVSLLVCVVARKRVCEDFTSCLELASIGKS